MNNGARYQIIVLKVHPNKELKVKELDAVKQYLQANYHLLTFCYGSPKNSLRKTLDSMLEKNLIFSPKNTLTDMMDIFVERGMSTYGEIIDYCTQKQARKFNETVSKGIKRVFGA
jgi:hypothetical protein